MRTRPNIQGPMIAIVVSALLALVAVAPAEAHHVMGGRVPTTVMDGLTSGLGHPVIGLDHLAFIVAMGVAVGAMGLHLAIPGLFIVASAIGVGIHVAGVSVPGSEALIAITVLFAGGALALARPPWSGVWGWAALFGVAGLLHGYAFGESIVGAEPSPLVAYLVGLAVIQGAIATVVARISRRGGTAAIETRLAGAVIAGIGIATLAGQLLPS